MIISAKLPTKSNSGNTLYNAPRLWKPTITVIQHSTIKKKYFKEQHIKPHNAKVYNSPNATYDSPNEI